MENRRIKSFGKDIVLFAMASFVPKVLSFILVPLYTSLLSTEEFGLFDLLGTIASLIIPILSLDIADAVLIFTLDYKDKVDKRNKPLSIAYIIIAFSSIFLLIALGLVSIFVNIEKIGIYCLYIFFFYLSSVLINTLTSYLRSLDRADLIVWSSLINSLVTIVSNVILVLFLRCGLYGLLIANLLGNISAVVLIYICIGGIQFQRFEKHIFDADLARLMLKYSIPLCFAGISWWINSSSDRIFISMLAGVSANGIYAVASKIPAILTACHSVIYQAIRMSIYRESEAEDKNDFQLKLYRLYSCVILIVCSFIIGLNKFIAQFLFAGDFFVAWKYAPALLISVAIFSLSGTLTPIYEVRIDSQIIAKSTMIGAVINTVLNIILIPKFELYGAVIATIAGYFVIWFILQRNLRKYKMKVSPLRVTVSTVLLIIQWGLLVYEFPLLFQFVVVILICLVNRKSLISIASMITRVFVRKKSI